MRSWREPKPASLSQPVPDLRDAACRRYFSPDYLAAGADPDEREAARHICLTACPVLEACRILALSVPVSIQGVIAGTGQAECARIRKEQRQREKERLAALVAERASKAHSRHPGALKAALAELRLDPARSDRLVAASAGVDAATVRRARRLDPALAPAPEARASRPLRRRSEVRDVLVLGATTREITRQTGATRQAVWRMRRSLANDRKAA